MMGHHSRTSILSSNESAASYNTDKTIDQSHKNIVTKPTLEQKDKYNEMSSAPSCNNGTKELNSILRQDKAMGSLDSEENKSRLSSKTYQHILNNHTCPREKHPVEVVSDMMCDKKVLPTKKWSSVLSLLLDKMKERNSEHEMSESSLMFNDEGLPIKKWSSVVSFLLDKMMEHHTEHTISESSMTFDEEGLPTKTRSSILSFLLDRMMQQHSEHETSESSFKVNKIGLPTKTCSSILSFLLDKMMEHHSDHDIESLYYGSVDSYEIINEIASRVLMRVLALSPETDQNQLNEGTSEIEKESHYYDSVDSSEVVHEIAEQVMKRVLARSQKVDQNQLNGATLERDSKKRTYLSNKNNDKIIENVLTDIIHELKNKREHDKAENFVSGEKMTHHTEHKNSELRKEFSTASSGYIDSLYDPYQESVGSSELIYDITVCVLKEVLFMLQEIDNPQETEKNEETSTLESVVPTSSPKGKNRSYKSVTDITENVLSDMIHKMENDKEFNKAEINSGHDEDKISKESDKMMAHCSEKKYSKIFKRCKSNKY